MASSHRDLFPRTDEKKALEQLEKFQRDIQSARWKREQASAEFDRFVKAFRESPQSETADAPDAGRTRKPTPSVVRATQRHSFAPSPRPDPPQGAPVVAPPRAPAPTRTADASPAAIATPAPTAVAATAAAVVQAESSVAESSVSDATVESEAPSHSMRLQHWRVIALVAAALLVVVLLATGWWKNGPQSSSRDGDNPSRAATQSAASRPSAVSSPAARPSPVTRPVAQHAVMLATTRRVWVRVMADGHRLFERELPAGENVPIDATQAIVIRAGDAGAVRLTFSDGRAETLGGIGQVVTKRYEVKK